MISLVEVLLLIKVLVEGGEICIKIRRHERGETQTVTRTRLDLIQQR